MYLWLLFPVLLYWLTELWLLSGRGEVDEDPVVFALKSPSTYWLGLVASRSGVDRQVRPVFIVFSVEHADRSLETHVLNPLRAIAV